MAMQFLPVVAESTTDKMVELSCAILELIFRSHAVWMTEGELADMERVWARFHRLKPVVVKLGGLPKMARFYKITKLHMVSHRPQSIHDLGTPDGYNTEAPKHLHMEFVKELWKHSNGVEALPQMIKYIQRQDARRIQQAHLNDVVTHPFLVACSLSRCLVAHNPSHFPLSGFPFSRTLLPRLMLRMTRDSYVLPRIV
jgi:hypothetical protein